MAEVRPPRLLVVDDERAHLQALRETLGNSGYEVKGCGGAHEALAALREARYDLLLTDLHMPDMDGIDLLRQAQQLDSSLVGIIMTGGGSIATAVAAMQSGALDYILKPFKLSTALPVLARALEVKALRDDNASLAARVQQQVQDLEAANQDLEAFSASVSHDLRAPVHAIGAFADVLAERHATSLDAKGLDYLQRIRAATTQMNELIDGLLRLALVARQPLELGQVDLQATAAAAVQDLAAVGLLQEGWIRVEPLAGVRGDAALLRQLFVNLLSNAGKFSSKQPLPSIVVGADTHDGSTAYFVRDNGAGFDMAYAQHLFEPFRRLHKAQEFAGLGVGLSIVARIVQRHGGRIWAEGEVGKGACFHFTLAPSRDG